MESKVGFIRFLAVCLLLNSFFVQGAQPSWQVKPSVCVTHDVGAVCQFNIQLTTEDLPDGEYCIFLQQQQMRCLKQYQFPVSLEVKISTLSELVLKNAQGQVVLSQPLSVKSLSANNHRRRLRSPWSLF